jgi:pimeloyl-ACP methyl ester carboxylesterase
VRREPVLAGARLVAGISARTAARSRSVATRPRLRWLVLQSVMRHPSRMPADFVYEQVSRADREGFLPALDAIVSYDYRDRLSQIGCPTLVVWGAEDMLVPRRDADEYERVIPNARKIVFDDTGHCPMMERPQTFNDCIVEFLAEEGAERPDEGELEAAKTKQAKDAGSDAGASPRATEDTGMRRFAAAD